MVKINFGEVPICPVCEEEIKWPQFAPRCSECDQLIHNHCGKVGEEYVQCEACRVGDFRSDYPG